MRSGNGDIVHTTYRGDQRRAVHGGVFHVQAQPGVGQAHLVANGFVCPAVSGFECGATEVVGVVTDLVGERDGEEEVCQASVGVLVVGLLECPLQDGGEGLATDGRRYGKVEFSRGLLT